MDQKYLLYIWGLRLSLHQVLSYINLPRLTLSTKVSPYDKLFSLLLFTRIPCNIKLGPIGLGCCIKTIICRLDLLEMGILYRHEKIDLPTLRKLHLPCPLQS